ncbi:MAG: hypothetical protein M1828_006585 [Chrysothrix sp. TS-e1954]|nr:MAG: hypothetical protein M1828_006585 [Chrysothrix sp. TS-e1954]
MYTFNRAVGIALALNAFSALATTITTVTVSPTAKNTVVETSAPRTATDNLANASSTASAHASSSSITHAVTPEAVPESAEATLGKTATPHIVSKTVLGFLDSTNAPDTVRDLGFAGHIGSTYLLSFGDNVVCTADHPQKGCEAGVVAANSVGIDLHPKSFRDFDLTSGHPQQFCKYLDSLDEYPTGSGLELSAIQEDQTGAAGFVYWQGTNRGSRPSKLTGAGFATVDISGAYPVCTRVPHYWWNTTTEPNWSDHGIVTHGGYVYIFGGGPVHNSVVYLMRVKLGQQATLSAYEYWHGSAFTTTKLINPKQSAAIFGAQPQNQGTIFFSEYYNQFMWVTVDQYASSIIASLAPHPQGPWSAFETVYNRPSTQNIIYAPSVRTQYSTAANKLVIHYTEAGNIQHVIEVVSPPSTPKVSGAKLILV